MCGCVDVSRGIGVGVSRCGCVAGAGAGDLGAWLCRGWGWCLEEAAVSRK